MAQFDVYQNLNPSNNKVIPYFLNIQNDILNHLSTRVVVPLVINENTSTLTPNFLINNHKVYMSTSEIATVPSTILEKKVCSLEQNRTQIINAIDFLITGY